MVAVALVVALVVVDAFVLVVVVVVVVVVIFRARRSAGDVVGWCAAQADVPSTWMPRARAR